jgi:hypothetical protein
VVAYPVRTGDRRGDRAEGLPAGVSARHQTAAARPRSAEVVEHDRLRVTDRALTVVEAATRQRGGAKLMDSALQRQSICPRCGRRI